MKRLLLAFALLFMSLNFIACAQKKENKTRLTQGANRNSGVNGTPTSSGWTNLNTKSYEVELTPSGVSPHQAAVNFLNPPDGKMGTVGVNSISMRLTFNNGNIVPDQTRMGLRFYDNQTAPYSYYLGTEITLKDGSRNVTVIGRKIGSEITVEFDDGGSVRIDGTINGNTFNGTVRYDGGNVLGTFSVPLTGAITGN